MHRPARVRGVKLLFSSIALVLFGLGCSVIVGNDVPEFGCSFQADGVCPSGQHCDVPLQKCVSDADGAPPGDEPLDEDAGDSSEKPDVKLEADIVVGPANLGGQCRVDNDCRSKLCGTSTALTTAITGTTGPICTQACCSSADCPASFVCFNGGTGGSYCVPATQASRSVGGSKAAGLACTTSAECRSGYCGTPTSETGTSVCIDTCCAASECGGSSICRIANISAPAPAHSVWVCAPPRPGATEAPGYSGSDCAFACSTNACSGSVNCRPPCSSTASCQTLTGFASGICIHGQIGTEFVRFCLKAPITGGGPIGATCNDMSECASDYCDTESKTCANPCGQDSDCGSTEACRPSAVGTPYLRCVPKPL